MRKFIQRYPSLVRLIMQFKQLFLGRDKFVNSASYWSDRYKNSGNSGDGSYAHLAEFKAEIVNDFVQKNSIQSVIEFGCGDGNQLGYFDFPKYTGVDVSTEAVSMCYTLFARDKTKTFITTAELSGAELADLSMSLDVIYHLVEDEVFEGYMNQLFTSSKKYVIVYSSNEDKRQTMDHVRSRKFSDWVDSKQPDFELIQFIPNRYPIGSPGREIKSIADFYFYQRKSK